MSETKIEKRLEDLDDSLRKFTEAITKVSEKSEKLQKWLIFWTFVMSLGVILQAIILAKPYFWKL